MEATAAYTKDFHAWLLRSAALLRERNFTELDADNIAEELEAMGRSERRELVSRLSVLIAQGGFATCAGMPEPIRHR